MLPKKFRLTVTAFNQIPAKPNDFSAVFLNIKTKKKEGGRIPQFAVVAPKKLDKRTSVRNRVKRIITEVVRRELPDIKNPACVVIKAKKVFKKENSQNIKKEVDFLFRKANLI